MPAGRLVDVDHPAAPTARLPVTSRRRPARGAPGGIGARSAVRLVEQYAPAARAEFGWSSRRLGSGCRAARAGASSHALAARVWLRFAGAPLQQRVGHLQAGGDGRLGWLDRAVALSGCLPRHA